MNNKLLPDLLYIALEKVAYAVGGGIFLWWFPFLNQWWIYLIVSPLFAIIYVWLYSEVPDGFTGKMKTSLASGITVGLSHLVSTSVVWYIVTHYGDRWRVM